VSYHSPDGLSMLFEMNDPFLLRHYSTEDNIKHYHYSRSKPFKPGNGCTWCGNVRKSGNLRGWKQRVSIKWYTESGHGVTIPMTPPPPPNERKICDPLLRNPWSAPVWTIIDVMCIAVVTDHFMSWLWYVY
jgi:hypothetical protein